MAQNSRIPDVGSTTVAILKGETIVGAGFVASKQIICTCAHVISSAGVEPGGLVSVRLFDGTLVNAHVEPQYWRGENAEDIAILSLETELNGIASIKLGASTNTRGHTFSTVGFPRSGQEIVASGEVIGVAVVNGIKFLQLDSRQLTPGFSGSPVYDETIKRVIGMVAAIAPPDEYQRMGTTAFAIPSELLVQVYPRFSSVSDSQLRKTGKKIERQSSSSNDSGNNQPPINPPDLSLPELSFPNSPPETSEFSQYKIHDSAIERHAATDKPIQDIRQDKLGFDVYVTALHDFIVSQYTTTPLTISVDGPWGAGKSSLMYMLKNSLEPQNNIGQRFISWLTTTLQWWRWFFLWFVSLPLQTFGRVLLWMVLKFDQVTNEFDFRIFKNIKVFRSLITDIAQGLSTNPEALKQYDDKLTPGVRWWARVHANCESMEPKSHPTIWLNAWKFDSQEEVWASLALATLEQLKQKHNIFWMAWFRIRLTFKRLSPLPAMGVVLLQFVLPVYLGVVAFYYTTIVESFDTPLKAFDAVTDGYGNYLLWAGGILSGILTVTSIFKDPFQIPVDKVFDKPNYKEKVGFLTRFEKDFARIVELVTQNRFGWKRSKLIIFVDDLDRCEPPKAADIVEAVNLFLDAEGCVFVIGMDTESVAMSIEVKYEDLFTRIKAESAGVVSLGRAFLEKIVQIPFTVPRATSDQIMNMVESTLGAAAPKTIAIAQPQIVITKSVSVTEGQEKPFQGAEQEPESESGIAEEKLQDDFDPASFARAEVRQAVRLGTELLSDNPRQVKTFVNLFRLSIYIANAKGFFEEERKGGKLRLIGLERLAIWVACSVRWQSLVRHLYAETQIDSLCAFLNAISKSVTSKYKWTTGRNNIPAALKKRIENLRKNEKGSEAHWCHLPWDWWLLEQDFLQVVKRMEILWATPAEGEVGQLKVLLNMSRPLSPTPSTEAK